MAQVHGYLTRTGRRVRPYTTKTIAKNARGESLGFLRHPPARVIPHFQHHAHRGASQLANSVIRGRRNRSIASKRQRRLVRALERVRSSRETLHPKHTQKSINLERRIIQELRQIRRPAAA